MQRMETETIGTEQSTQPWLLYSGETSHNEILIFKLNLALEVDVNRLQNNRNLSLDVLHTGYKFDDPSLNGWLVMVDKLKMGSIWTCKLNMIRRDKDSCRCMYAFLHWL